MSRLAKVIAVAALSALAATPDGGAGAVDQGPYPVWRSPRLHPPGPGGLERQLNQDFIQSGTISLARIVGGKRRQAIVNNCASYGAWLGEGYRPTFEGQRAARTASLRLIARCRALETMKRAKSAGKSYLRRFKFNVAALGALPATLRVANPCNEVPASTLEASTARPWREKNEGTPIVDVTGEDLMIVWLNGEGIRVEKLGLGDFDGDGVEDMLIRRRVLKSAKLRERTDLFILTRDEAGAMLRVSWPEYPYRGPDCTEY